MSVKLNPYLSFSTNAREAMEFYHAALGGELQKMTFGEGGMSDRPEAADLIMHAQLESEGMTIMASDTPPGMAHQPGTNISISLSGGDEAKLRGYWDRLSPGGQVTMPLEKAPWGDTFGMFTDRFGIQWMVNISGRAHG